MAKLPLAGMTTVGGTGATAGVGELREMIRSAGAADVRTKVILCVVPRSISAVGGPNSAAVVRTSWLSPESPKAEAVIVEVPKFAPVTCGWRAGTVSPARITTVVGFMVTFDASLLASITY